ncbi:hypothetical protein Pint_05196 [Pistacia integerrima]|uniref:Uncharacterized protein n=1 Tax=Pistacia integerrima TaxID=434235 RepID=A0ACC0Z7Z2_9ROSI|nr:hypothetical protein Pint_05196 [Pistacia integerrima]
MWIRLQLLHRLDPPLTSSSIQLTLILFATAHLSSLKHELIDLIDRDCADFVNLNTKLVDVDAAVIRMQAPLLELRERIEGFIVTVEGSILALQSGLKKRSEVVVSREALELLLDTFHVVSKCEAIQRLLETNASDTTSSAFCMESISKGCSAQYHGVEASTLSY